MPIFMIDGDDNITLLASEEDSEQPLGSERFQSEEQLASLAAQWPGSRLIAVWNSISGVQPVKRFTDRQTAVSRIWKAIQSLAPGGAPLPVRSRKKRASNRKRGQRAARGNTKSAQVIALLEQPTGASLKSIMSATGWQAHSVRGFISGHLGKKLGLRVKSFERDGERVYALRR